MANFIIVQIPSNGSLLDLANSVNNATKAHENLNRLIDILSGYNGGTKSGTIEIVTTSTQNTFTTTGSNSADNSYKF